MGLVLSSGAWGEPQPVETPTAGSRPPTLDGSVFELNEMGQTFGPVPEVWASLEELPDLVEAIATNGKVGYIPKEILFPPPPSSLHEAGARSMHVSAATPVFKDDGRTVVGEFEFTPSND